MKNKTRRPTLIIHPAPKQSQHDFLKTKLEGDSPFTASQHLTSTRPSESSDFPTCVNRRVPSAHNAKSANGFFLCHIKLLCITTYQLGLNIGPHEQTDKKKQ